MKLERPLVVMDLETTGTWIEKDRIVEIGMIKRHPDGRTESYLKRVNPGMPIPAAVSRLIGIKDEDVAHEPPFKSIAKEVLEFLDGADIGGYNVERFDLPILEREVFDSGLRLEWRTRSIYDAQKIYHHKERRDLSAAYKYYCGKNLENAHSAMGDSLASLEILEAQVHTYGEGAPSLEVLKPFQIERRSDFFDRERKFRWWNRELYPVFGKYARRLSLKEIARKDRPYLEWMLTTDFDESVKAMLRDVLAGKSPVHPEESPAD